MLTKVWVKLKRGIDSWINNIFKIKVKVYHPSTAQVVCYDHFASILTPQNRWA